MCWKWHQMSALAERSGRGEVKPSLFQAVMKTDARALTQGAQGKPQLLEPPGADPHAGWCGRGTPSRASPMPIILSASRRPNNGVQGGALAEREAAPRLSQAMPSNSAVLSRRTARATTVRWISDVPSKIR